MKLKLDNQNYNGTFVAINKLVPLQGCDNIQHADIFGNLVIVSKYVKIGDIGIFFPVETKLSSQYLYNNSLYRDSTQNKDTTKKGFFEPNGRIRCVKLRKFPSMGLFMPTSSLDFIGKIDEVQIGSSFNSINDIEICRKYVIETQHSKVAGKPRAKTPRISKLIPDQFRFHYDSEQLWRNTGLIHPEQLITISYKIHGTSFISSNILCRKKLNPILKLLSKIGLPIITTEYDYIYASRRVVKNEFLYSFIKSFLYNFSFSISQAFKYKTLRHLKSIFTYVKIHKLHYYDEDIWGIVNEEIKSRIPKGVTLYGEIAGYLSNGKYIQKQYDYGCEPGEHKSFIYRITYTNPDGEVFEFSMKQVSDFCNHYGLNCVPILYEGYAKDIVKKEWKDTEEFRNLFLEEMKNRFTDKDCYMCKNKVPEEGCVIRISGYNGALKCKSLRFLEFETKMLDEQEENIEDQQ